MQASGACLRGGFDAAHFDSGLAANANEAEVAGKPRFLIFHAFHDLPVLQAPYGGCPIYR